MGKGAATLIALILAFLFSILTVSAAQSELTNMTVYIINTGPTVGTINVTPDPAEPLDIMRFEVNITDANGVPDDIDTVNGVLDMGTPGVPGDDVTISFTHNATNELYYNITYQIPVAATFGTWTINITVTDDFALSDSGTQTFTVTDTTDPVINNISDTPDPVDPGATINFTANVTDNVNVNATWVEISGTNYSMTQSGSSDIWYYDTFDTNIAAGTYDYTVYANDTYGNTATPVSSNFTINSLISLSLEQIPVAFGNTTIPVTDRRADNGTAGSGYTGGTIKGFPMMINNTGNVNENFSISGTDLTGLAQPAYEVGVGNVSYDLDDGVAGASTLTTTLTQFTTSVIAMNNYEELYFWISIPSGLPSQNYKGDINITASQS
jgi:hypothetical protein